jgi:hypothetical protein
VGRRSTLQLAAFMHRMELVTPSVTMNYSLKQFKTDLKQLLVRVTLVQPVSHRVSHFGNTMPG